jgi:UDP-N-acetylglucosamine--N-acetylmuramyl-(pentapeptide) pyrophosphoryl-undecaprenol N-acetylglucosamine transferase
MRVLIAGGGTGGHLFPGVAIAEEVMRQAPDSEVLFVGTERGIEARILPELGWRLAFIQVSGLKTVGPLQKVLGLLRLPRSLWQSLRLLRQFRPDAVIGVGGYASGPVLLVARLTGRPTAILEQNSIPGLANRILGRLVQAVFLSFDDARRFFRPGVVHLTGNPIRRAIREALGPESTSHDTQNTGPEKAALGTAGGPPTLLVMGGSQGAVAVNTLVCEAGALLAARGLHLRIVHQTGAADLERVQARWRELGIAVDCRPFIQDLATEYSRCDLVVCRAGATTVAELGIAGRPAIFIPYPFAADNHQELNAREMVNRGAALMMRQAELTAGQLADAIADLLADPERLAAMRRAMKSLGRPDAARDIVHWCRDHSFPRALPNG